MNKLANKNEIFIKKARLIHGNKYDYSLVDYINAKTKFKILCQIHGVFEQVPNYHLSKCGCISCGIDKIIKNNKGSKSDFIKKANLVHNNKYNYSKINYFNAHTKISIICQEHGEFTQTPNNHLSGKGCSICVGMDRNLTTEKVIVAFNDIHKNKYDYSLVNYVNNSVKIQIICPIHGKFNQTPQSHRTGVGCPVCCESKGENKIKEFMNKNNISFIQQKRFKDCKLKKPLPFDFYLPEHNTCIEYNGKQHYVEVPYWGGETYLKLQQTRDKIKLDYCNKNNIKLIVIKYNENVSDILSELFDIPIVT